MYFKINNSDHCIIFSPTSAHKSAFLEQLTYCSISRCPASSFAAAALL